MQYRRKYAGRRNELLARAIGLSPQDQPFIVDATAGLGRDSFILAHLGFNITLIERSAMIHGLLQDALNHAACEPKTTDIVKRIQLIHADAICWLNTQSAQNRPDVIYLDPMFPERKKSASCKKEMLLLQDLLKKDENMNNSNNNDLFCTALAYARKRVVVKRPRLSPNVDEHAPNFTIMGKSSRFDVYLVSHD